MSQPERTSVSRMDPTAVFRGRKVQSSSTLNRKEVVRTQAGNDRPCCSRSSIGRAASWQSSVQAARTAGGLNVRKVCTPLEYRSQSARRTDPRNQETEVTRRSSSQARTCSPGFSGNCCCDGSLLPDGNPRWADQRWLSPDRRPLIMILELILAAEASVLSASWIRRSRKRRQQILLGGSTPEINLPFLDQYLRQQTTNPTRLQTFAAQKLAAVCRHAVHTQAFELLVLKLIQSASRRSRRESEISKVEVIL